MYCLSAEQLVDVFIHLAHLAVASPANPHLPVEYRKREQSDDSRASRKLAPRHDFISARLVSGGFNPRGDLLTEFIMTTLALLLGLARVRGLSVPTHCGELTMLSVLHFILPIRLSKNRQSHCSLGACISVGSLHWTRRASSFLLPQRLY